MRAPRYRFPDEVRSTTRGIASRMVRDGTVAATPEELDAWIAGRPEVAERLARGGYGTAFTSHDLFPLLQVFLGPDAVQPAAAGAPPRASRSPWWTGIIALLVILLLIVLATQFL